jgi:TolB protein
MSIHIRRRRVLVAALLGATVAALTITVASRATTASVHNGRIAVAHHVLVGDTESVAILTMNPDGSDPRTLAPGSAPAWGAGNRLYAEGEQAGNVHVFTMNAAGRDVRQITRTDGFEFTPDVSRSGVLLTFEHDNADFTSGGIFVSSKHGGTLADFRQVTAAPPEALAVGGFDGDPAFAPDARSIAFMRMLDPTPRAAQSAIFVVRTDGRGLRQLTPYAMNASRPSWSPDGTTIVFSTNGDNFPAPQQIYVVDVRTGAITQLTHDALPVRNFLPDWSPDGARIVFDRWQGLSHFDLLTMNPDGSDVTTIWSPPDGTFDFRPAWGSKGGDD